MTRKRKWKRERGCPMWKYCSNNKSNFGQNPIRAIIGPMKIWKGGVFLLWECKIQKHVKTCCYSNICDIPQSPNRCSVPRTLVRSVLLWEWIKPLLLEHHVPHHMHCAGSFMVSRVSTFSYFSFPSSSIIQAK